MILQSGRTDMSSQNTRAACVLRRDTTGTALHRLTRRNRCFTLIELLIVISIVAVLAGILLPAVGKVRRKADVTQAKSEMKNLETAIKQYEATYGFLPVAQDSSNETWADGYDQDSNETELGDEEEYYKLIGNLSNTGTIGGNDLENPRMINFLAVDQSATYLDPWGYRYRIAWDMDYDGRIPENNIYGCDSDDDEAYASVVIWSVGPDEEESSTTTNSRNEDNIYSIPTVWADGTGHQPE